METKKTQDSQNRLEKENKAKGNTLPDFRLYSNYSNQNRYWHKNPTQINIT